MLYRRVQPLIHYSNKFAQIIHIRQVIYYWTLKCDTSKIKLLILYCIILFEGKRTTTKSTVSATEIQI
jgi:hypothetical protein